MGSLNNILILFAHPALEKSRVNRHLIRAVKQLEGITVHDLYQTYPDFHINVKAEQDLLLSHNIIVFHHPFYWYSSPAILKEWQDLVLEHGFAYGHTGTALQGKMFLTAITTGGGEPAYCRKGYNYFTIRELLAPFEQTAHLCGMKYLPPFVVYGTHMLQQKHEVDRYATEYRNVLMALRDDLIDWERLKAFYYLNQNVEQIIKTPMRHE
jgi:glutathione-regulated potassium-efflux system ancillary protein KefG